MGGVRMKKCFLILVTATIIFCSTMVLAQEKILFDVIQYNFDMFFHGEKMNLKSPILLVDGQTYVPLREMAKYLNLDVEWQKEEQKIDLSYKLFDANATFNEIFEFDLPESAKILNYGYSIDSTVDQKYMSVKISFKESDLLQIQERLNSTTYAKHALSEKSLEHHREWLEEELACYTDRYDWWELLTLDDCDTVYYGLKTGTQIKTVEIKGFICKQEGEKSFYLYLTNML